MYGLIVRFDIKVEFLDQFDELARTALEGIKTDEPGTLTYLVASAQDSPHSRIFIEIYQDHDAFLAHEAYPHMIPFLKEFDRLLESIRIERFDGIHGKWGPL